MIIFSKGSSSLRSSSWIRSHSFGRAEVYLCHTIMSSFKFDSLLFIETSSPVCNAIVSFNNLLEISDTDHYQMNLPFFLDHRPSFECKKLQNGPYRCVRG